MKKYILFIITIAVLLMLPVLSGCSLLAPIEDKVGKAINRYCKEPQEARKVLRSSVNKTISPNQIKIWCEGDTDPKIE